MSDTTGFIDHLFSGFYMNFRGGMSVDRDALHSSAGYRRQVEALEELRRHQERTGSETKGG